MKKFLLTTAFILATTTAAQAQVNLDVNFGGPAYVEPAPVYVAHPAYYRDYGHTHHHHDYDYGYWNRDRHDDRHDNGRHNGWDKHR